MGGPPFTGLRLVAGKVSLSYNTSFVVLVLKVSHSYDNVTPFIGLHFYIKLSLFPVNFREETVAVLVSLGADAGALTDPSPELPLGKTAADLAYGKEHRGISGFLAESSLTSYLEKLTMVSKENSPANSSGSKAVQTVSERTAAPMSYGDVPEKLSMKDSLTAVRNATQAANRLHQVFRMQSFQRKQLSGFDDDDDELGISNELAVSFAASKTKNPGQSEVFAHSAATHIQKKYRGWKKRKEFLLIRQRVVKIQVLPFTEPFIPHCFFFCL